jgi:hypothetical protein
MSVPQGATAWLRDLFDSEVCLDVFGRSSPSERPVLVLLGGQPAAGKTYAHDRILAERPELVPVTGDDLRVYHPGYLRLVIDEPLRMPNATAPTSNGLIRLALDHAVKHRYSVLLEGTFRDSAMVTGTAQRFADTGYRVEVVAVTVPGSVPRLGAEQRFLGAPDPRLARWTPPEAHESALAASAAVVAALEAMPVVARVQVSARDRRLYDNSRTPTGWIEAPHAAELVRALTALRGGNGRQWSAESGPGAGHSSTRLPPGPPRKQPPTRGR